MALNSAANRAGGAGRFNPMQIAHHSLFTAREKLDLLQHIKSEIAVDGHIDIGFGPDEIDEAIEEVKLGAQSGRGSETAPRGDN